jgi:fatty acid desaturase
MISIPSTELTRNIMKVNVGSADRAIRIIAGVVLIILAATGVFSPWGWIGIVPLLTGIFKFCPAYTLLGMNTCPMDKK